MTVCGGGGGERFFNQFPSVVQFGGVAFFVGGKVGEGGGVEVSL